MTGIRFKIVAFASVAVLVPSVVLGLMAYSHSHRLLREKVAQELAGVASIAARDLDLWLKRRLHELNTFAAASMVTEALAAAAPQDRVTSPLPAYLQSLGKRYPEYLLLALVREDGQVLAAAPGKTSGRLPLPPPAGESGARALAAPGLPGVPSRLRLFVYVTGPGGTTGALAADIDPAPLRSRAAEVSRDLDLLVLDRTGHLVLSSRESLPTRPLRASPGARGLAAGTRPARYLNEYGTEVLGAAARTREADLTVVSEQASGTMGLALADLRRQALWVAGALLAALGTAAYLFSLSLARPLERLADGARRVAEGDLAVTLPGNRRDELGYLTQVFNDMVMRLREGREAVARVHVQLLDQNIRLETLTVTDSLTGLFNRKSLSETIQYYISRFRRNGRPFCLLMLDIDHFKVINDRYGHLVGDTVLRQFAAVISGSIRSVDYAARYGGEEFTLLLDETAQAEAWDTAERIRLRVAEEAISADGLAISITVSIGISEVCAGDDEPDALLGRADSALYEAKRAGRDRVCFKASPPQDTPAGQERLLGRL